jgi:predicted nucleic acid-binding protein
MKYVLDSCVGIKWLLAEADSDKAVRIRDDFQRQVHDLIAPDVFPIEVAHALSRAERQGRITAAEGQSHFKDMIVMLPTLQPYLPLLPRAYELSSQTRIGVYDCLYVTLIEREGCELLTADDRLKRSLPSHRIRLLSSMP